jgi:hypothetical protein
VHRSTTTHSQATMSQAPRIGDGWVVKELQAVVHGRRRGEAGQWRGRGSKAGNRGAWTEKLSKEDLGWRRSAVADADCRAEGSPDCSRRSGAGRPAADAPAHAPDRVDRPSPHNRTRQRCCCIAVSCAAAHHRSPAGCRTQVRCREMQFCEPQPGPLHNDCCLLGYWVDAMLPVGLGGMVGIGQLKFWPNSLLPICLP